MGYELGPGFLRRAPSGWLPARAFPVQHKSWQVTGAAPTDLIMSCRLQATWEVQIEGHAPYRFTDGERDAPLWIQKGGVTGKRWYRVRVRAGGSLEPSIGVPCAVNPSNGADIWIDWDAAYEEHTQAWERRARVEREVARRDNPIMHLHNIVANPLAGGLKPGEEHLVEEAIQREREREAAEAERYRPAAEAQMARMGFAPVAADEQSEYQQRVADMQRIHTTGRPARATVVGNTDSGRRLANIPVILIVLDVEDGGAVRRVTHEHVWGPRHARRYKPGKRIEVRVDPRDPGSISLGR